eukprot:scaffold20116_cov69-Cyclotella_meneghiniana.AAC.12
MGRGNEISYICKGSYLVLGYFRSRLSQGQVKKLELLNGAALLYTSSGPSAEELDLQLTPCCVLALSTLWAMQKILYTSLSAGARLHLK